MYLDSPFLGISSLPTGVRNLFPVFWATINLVQEMVDWSVGSAGECPGPSAQTATLTFSTGEGNPLAVEDEGEETRDLVVMREVSGVLAAAAM